MEIEVRVVHAGAWKTNDEYKIKDYSPYVGELSISDNINSLGAHLRISVDESMHDRFFHKTFPGVIPVGSKIFLRDKKTNSGLFSGTIVSKEIIMPGNYIYEAYDDAFYLNKSMVSVQFNNIDACTAIEDLCRSNSIMVGSICKISTKIRKIYHANTIIDVIRDILNQAELELGTKYRVEMRVGNRLHIEEYKNLEVKLEPVAVNSVDTVLPQNAIIDSRYNETMENMITEVQVVSGSERYLKIEGFDEATTIDGDPASYTYGKIREVIRIDGKNKSQVDNIIKKRIEESGKPDRALRLKLFGDIRVRSGRIINAGPYDSNKPWTLSGKYLVKSCVHTYDRKTYHTMELELEYQLEENNNA